MADKRNLKQRAKDAGNVWKAGKASLSAEMTPEVKRRLIDVGIIFVVTVILLGIYYYYVQIWQFQMIFAIYMAVWAVFFIAYWVYNRGFSRKGVTPDMLPDEWSDAKKEQFIEDGKRRMKKSRWMIYIIAPLCFVFIVEMFLAFVWPTIYGVIQSAVN
jgi:uncharacterized membrane protein (DUF373 family)